MFHALRSRFVAAALGVAVLVSLLGVSGGSALAEQSHRQAVYTSSNATAGNAVLVFNRAPDGGLTAAGSFSTGGTGTGAGLGSQGALALNEEGNRLFVVNAGSNDVSVLAVRQNGLSLLDRVSSGGLMPISLTVRRHLLYVLNAGTPNISGFRIEENGHLSPIAGSTQALSAGAAGPAEVAFSPNGEWLAVTEKGSSKIDTYKVNDHGVASAAVTTVSHGSTPFGFAFDPRGRLIVSEAAANAVSSYDVAHNGALNVVTGSLVDVGQGAPCWVAVTENGRYAYAANAHSGTITGFKVGHDGSLTLLNASAITGQASGLTVLDMAFSDGDKFLYVLNGMDKKFNVFAVGSDGSLTNVGNSGAFTTSAGIAAR